MDTFEIEEIEIEPGDTQVSEITTVDEIIKKILRGEKSLSFSSFKNFAESPADAVAYWLQTWEQTEAMIYGSMVHCLVLEPADFYNRYFVLDDAAKCEEIGGAKPRSTTKYKDWFAEMTANSNGRILVKSKDYDFANAIAIGVKLNPVTNRILNLCPLREQMFEWEYQNYKFKGIKDGEGDHAIFDLKTVTDANPKKVARDILNNKYYLQAAMYIQDTKKDYYIIAVDKKGGKSVNQLSPALIEKGRKEYEYLTAKFSECVLRDAWSSSYEFHADRFDGIYNVERPGWE